MRYEVGLLTLGRTPILEGQDAVLSDPSAADLLGMVTPTGVMVVLLALQGLPPYFEKAKKRSVCHDKKVRTSYIVFHVLVIISRNTMDPLS